MHSWPRILVGLTLLVVSSATQSRAQIPDRKGWPLPIEMSVPLDPTPVPSAGVHLLIYEIRATNLGELARTIESVEVLDRASGMRLSMQTGDVLDAHISTIVDADKTVQDRLETARQEYARRGEFDIEVINSDLSIAVDEIRSAL